MRIELNIGNRTVHVETYDLVDHEEDATWQTVLDELVWPAFRAWGYILDHEFTDHLQDYHHEYLQGAYADKLVPAEVEEPEEPEYLK